MSQLQSKVEEQDKETVPTLINTIEDVDAVIQYTRDQELSVEEMRMMLEIYDLAKDGLKYRGEK